jgi:hypothetical protein
MQGFPDTHYLCGKYEKKFEQVGNAVCARLAQNIGLAMGLGEPQAAVPAAGSCAYHRQLCLPPLSRSAAAAACCCC